MENDCKEHVKTERIAEARIDDNLMTESDNRATTPSATSEKRDNCTHLCFHKRISSYDTVEKFDLETKEENGYSVEKPCTWSVCETSWTEKEKLSGHSCIKQRKCAVQCVR